MEGFKQNILLQNFCTNLKLSTETLIKVVHQVVAEKDEFKYQEKSTLKAVLEFSD